MIYIKDDFLDINLIDLLRTNKDEFQEVKTPGKSFWVKEVPASIMQIIKFELEDLEGHRIEPILGFMREAKEGQDRDWRIHNDSIIEGQQPDRACVLYISDCKQEGLNGTAFWEHKKHGDKFENVSIEEQPHHRFDLECWHGSGAPNAYDMHPGETNRWYLPPDCGVADT